MAFEGQVELVFQHGREGSVHLILQLFFIRIFEVGDVLDELVLDLAAQLQRQTHVDHLLDLAQLLPPPLPMRDDQVDDAVGEVHKDDLNEQHAEVDIQDLIIVFWSGDAIATRACSFHRPVERIDVRADPPEGLLDIDIVEEVGAVEPQEAHVVELALIL